MGTAGRWNKLGFLRASRNHRLESELFNGEQAGNFPWMDPDSLERFRAAIAKNPQNELARFSLGKALFDAGRFADAQEQFSVALEKKADWMAVQILLGKCRLELGDRTGARESFRKALDLAVAQNHESPREEVQELLRQTS